MHKVLDFFDIFPAIFMFVSALLILFGIIAPDERTRMFFIYVITGYVFLIHSLLRKIEEKL